jgi:hypothetical protein
MPSFSQSLFREDYDRIKIIYALWGEEGSFRDVPSGIQQLENKISNPAYFETLFHELDLDAQHALQDLAGHEGRITWTTFLLRYGDFREMGVSRRDREKPFETPISTTEYLYYRGLIARGHFPTSRGILEHAYLPDDLVDLVPAKKLQKTVLGRPARVTEMPNTKKVGRLLMETFCTYLICKRNEMDLTEMTYLDEEWVLYPGQLEAFALEMGLIDELGEPIPQAVKTHLSTPIQSLLTQSFVKWRESERLHELALLPNLEFDELPSYDAKNTRRFILNAVSDVPKDTWWHLDSFIGDIQQSVPDFLRIHGNFDAWLIRDRQSKKLLSGVEHWDDIEGALIRFVVGQVLFGFGFVEIGMSELGVVSAFRVSEWAAQLLANQPVKEDFEEVNKVTMNSEGTIETYTNTERVVRYQIGRFADWSGKRNNRYQYQISAGSLEMAEAQDLRTNQLVRLLAGSLEGNIPPNIVQAIEEWDKYGTEVKIQQVTVLNVTSESVLQKILNSPAQKYLGGVLGKTSVVINEGAEDKVMKIVSSLGYFSEIQRRES